MIKFLFKHYAWWEIMLMSPILFFIGVSYLLCYPVILVVEYFCRDREHGGTAGPPRGWGA